MVQQLSMASGFGLLVPNPKQEREAKVLRNSVLKHFQHPEDPRADRGRNHSPVSIITIAILAVLAGADGFVATEAYGPAILILRFHDIKTLAPRGVKIL
jgi:hypothetical protein